MLTPVWILFKVKWPNLQQILQLCYGHSARDKYLKLSGFDILPSTYNLYISDFVIGDLRSGQFRDLPIISQWGKTQVPQILIISVQIIQKHAQLGYCWWSRSNFANVTPRKVIWGHIMTSRGQWTLFVVTFGWIEIRTWDRCQMVPLFKVHQMICNMTYLGQLLTLT